MIYIVMIIQENPPKEKEDRAEETKEHVPPCCCGCCLPSRAGSSCLHCHRLIKDFSSLNDSKIIQSTSKPNSAKSKKLKGHQLSWLWWICYVAGFFLPMLWPDTKGRDRFPELPHPSWTPPHGYRALNSAHVSAGASPVSLLLLVVNNPQLIPGSSRQMEKFTSWFIHHQ